MKKRKFTQTTAILLMVCALIGPVKMSLVAEAATVNVAIQVWDLVDNGKHLDWDGGTKYSVRWKNSIARWNDLKAGMIRKDSLLVIQDVYVSDVYSSATYAGITYADGRIRFNTRVMEPLSAAERGQVCTHELGHALGLKHNLKTDVMYEKVTGRYKLSANDKASFKKSYSTY